MKNQNKQMINLIKTCEWADKVMKRANYKCEWCGTTENIYAHHTINKKTNPERQFDVDAGMCLCKSCHKKYHHWNKHNKY